MQEDIEYKSVVFAVRAARFGGQTLAKLCGAAHRSMKNFRAAPRLGKQSIEQLSRSGSLQSIEITGDNIKSFEPVARKYGIGFALKKDPSVDPPRWFVFFRAKEADQMTAAFAEFSAKAMKHDRDRPSVRETMRDLYGKLAQTVRDKTKHKRREGPER